MRWLVLYLRSRQAPAGTAAMLVAVAAIWSFAMTVHNGRIEFVLMVLAVAVGVAVTSTGLSGTDADLERTAAIAWLPHDHDGEHVAGAAVAAVLMGLREVDPSLIIGEVVLRDAAGLAGLGAVAFGGQAAWCPVVSRRGRR